MFRLPKDTEMTLDILAEYMDKHKKLISGRYRPLQDTYLSDHAVLHQKPKPDFKPDNRIVVNFAKYIVDTMNGFFIGNPIKVTTDDTAVSDYVDYIRAYNDQDNSDADLAKSCSIYGKAYEMYFVDEVSELCMTALDPTEAFMIYDDSIRERPLFFVRFYTDHENVERGSISNASHVRYFKSTGGYAWMSEWEPHYFDGVPAAEYVENSERQSLFEPVLSMIDAYDKAISEKANDVDYFADAYLKILGAHLEDEDLQDMRDKRIINLEGDAASDVVAEFLDKPDSDTTQEHLIDRLERLIYQISMVANVSDENFGTSSGIALKYKLLAMSNLEKTKERKFISAMNRRYQLLFSNPVSKVAKDAWVDLNYTFTPNIPSNLLEESQIAGNLSGITSHETQLKSLSIVDNVKDEMKRVESEKQIPAADDYPTARLTDASNLLRE